LSETKKQIIELEKYYKTDQICNTCGGPLEVDRDHMCTKCKLKKKVSLFLDIIENNTKDARSDLNKYMKVEVV
jgi:tRNA(Ile2) C34 agmatinyltransferase TiaS